MCAKCTEFDGKIAHYQGMAMRITDQLALDGIAGLIKKMTEEKAAIHSEPKEKGSWQPEP